MAPMFPLVVIVHADDELRVSAAHRVPRLQRGRRPGADRGAGHRGAAPRGRRRLAGQLRQRGRTGGAGPRRCGTSASCRSRTTCRPGSRRRADAAAGAVRPVLARPGAAHRGPAEHRVRAPGHPDRPHRFDRGSRAGRQGRHRHPGHGRLAGHRRRTRRRAAGRRLSAGRGDHRATSPSPTARSTVAAFDHTDDPIVVAQAISRLSRSGPADQRAPAGRRLAQSAVRAAVRRLADRQPWCAGRLPGGQARSRGRRGIGDTGAYADAKEPWFLDAYRRAWEWADATGWRP